jgi:hypothetical protein
VRFPKNEGRCPKKASAPAMARDASPLNVLSSSQLPPSPPAEKATARQDQARQASTGDGTLCDERKVRVCDLVRGA